MARMQSPRESSKYPSGVNLMASEMDWRKVIQRRRRVPPCGAGRCFTARYISLMLVWCSTKASPMTSLPAGRLMPPSLAATRSILPWSGAVLHGKIDLVDAGLVLDKGIADDKPACGAADAAELGCYELTEIGRTSW